MVAETPRGTAMRARIVEAAAELILCRGVAGTTLDDVRAATGASKSQLFHYFPQGKTEIVHAVAGWRAERMLADQRPVLEALDSWEAFDTWRDLVIDGFRQRMCAGGCPMGSLASELVDGDPDARSQIAAFFTEWQGYVEAGLRAMQERGELREDAEPESLALATLAALQGGIVLARTAQSMRPLEVSLDAAIGYLRSWSAPLRPRAKKKSRAVERPSTKR